MNDLKEVFEDIIGEYETKTETVHYYDETNQTTIQYTETIHGLVGLDWPWIASALLLLICVSSLFKAIGGMLKW